MSTAFFFRDFFFSCVAVNLNVRIVKRTVRAPTIVQRIRLTRIGPPKPGVSALRSKTVQYFVVSSNAAMPNGSASAAIVWLSRSDIIDCDTP